MAPRVRELGEPVQEQHERTVGRTSLQAEQADSVGGDEAAAHGVEGRRNPGGTAAAVSTFGAAGADPGRSYPENIMETARFTGHMSDEDALMWHIEKDPILRSTILAVAIFDRPPDWRRLRARIDRATRVIPRLRQRVLSPPFRIGPPRWSVEPTFDLDFHLRRLRLPAPGDAPHAARRAATDRVVRVRPRPPAVGVHALRRPRLDADGERAALAMKVHHSVTDGVGGMALLAELVDLEREPRPDLDERPRRAVPAAGARSARSRSIRDSLTHTSRRAARRSRAASRARVAATTFARGARSRSARRPTSALHGCARSARLLAPATTPMSPVMRERGLGRRLDDVRTSASTTCAGPRRRPRAASTTCSSPR